MDDAVELAWTFFTEMCSASPRGLEIFGGALPTNEEVAVVKDLLRDGSRRHKAARRQRIRGARRFIDEVCERGWSPWDLTPLQQAA